MRAPYKYPYISIFIIGYYLLEHQGYYYRLRKYLGYKEVDEIDYVVHLDLEKFNKLAAGPSRRMLMHCYTESHEVTQRVFNKTAMKAKEKQRSPVIFSDVDCREQTALCQQLHAVCPSMLYVVDKTPQQVFEGPFHKKKILKFLSKAESFNKT